MPHYEPLPLDDEDFDDSEDLDLGLPDVPEPGMRPPSILRAGSASAEEALLINPALGEAFDDTGTPITHHPTKD